MSADENILVEVSPGETRAAFVGPQDRLCELIVERTTHLNLADAVYLGRVLKIEKALGAAFVDIGLPEAAFLDRASGLHEGEAVVVQVTRGAAAGKGMTVRRRIVLTGRYLTLTPGGEELHWPRGIGGGRRRADVEKALAGIPRDGEGWAIRSIVGSLDAADVDGSLFSSEAEHLRGLWQEIEEAGRAATPPAKLLAAPGLTERLLRDRLARGALVIDDRREFLAAEKLVGATMPDLSDALLFHGDAEPMFDRYDIEAGIEAAIERTVGLPRGGRLTIDTTEALTVFDVDMGGAGERRRGEDAVLALNTTSAEAVAREVRLRNIGGLIVVDFITMRGKGPRQKLVEAQRRAFRDSPVPVDVLGITAAGLVEITRRRDGPSLAEVLTAPASAKVRLSRETLACAALRSALRVRGAGRLTLVVSPEIGNILEVSMSTALEGTKRRLGGGLDIEVDADETEFRIDRRRSGQ